MLVGLKSRVISRNLGLYGFKFGKLTASVEDFSDLISYNYVDPLQAPPIGIKVKDPIWYLKSNHKVYHSNICGNVHQKCKIQVSTIYPNASLCINEKHTFYGN
jgi:hypothetical protein